MRIAISGPANTGKTTLANDIITAWPMYKILPSYRDQIKDRPHSSKTTEVTQELILNHMKNELEKLTPEDNVVMDRCPLDNLVYTLWGRHNNIISADYANNVIPKIRETFKNIDIIFLTFLDPSIKIEQREQRDTDNKWLAETNAIFQIIFEEYIKNDENTYIYFPKDNMPALIDISGDRSSRLEQIAEYIDASGTLITTDPNESVFSEEQLKIMQQLKDYQEKLALEDKWSI